MNKLQSNLFQLLKEINEICKENNISYFLAGGTALGTVRNHCFLPWDDDIDLYITRDNWNKLKQALEEKKVKISESRSFAYIENTEYYCNPIPRYIDNSTTAIYKSQALPGKACGQHIELLIMDPLPKDETESKKYIQMLKVYTELVSPYFIVNKNLSIEEFEKHYKLYNKYYWMTKLFGRKRIINWLEKMFERYSEEDCEVYCMRWGINILKYKKEHFGKGRLEYFEDEKFPVGEIAEGIFRIAYGDSWMYVPEYEEQVVHNALKDLDTPFKEYTEKYIPKVNRKKVFKVYQKRKRNSMKAFVSREKLSMDITKTNAKIFMMTKAEDLENSIPNMKKDLQEKNYTALSEKLSEYYAMQLDKMTRKYNIYLPVSDEFLAIALRNYIEQGKYFTANNILKLRTAFDKPFSDEIKELECLINICRELSVARYDNQDYKKVKEIIAEYDRSYPEQIDILRSRIWVLEKEKKWEDICALSETILQMYPNDGETMAYLAQANKELGELKKAEELYKTAIFNTRNGLIWEKVKMESGISRIEEEARDE